MQEYYHVKIVLKGNSNDERIENLSKKALEDKIVIPYRTGKEIFVNGKGVNPYEIERIFIRKTNQNTSIIAERIRREDEISNRNSGIIMVGGPYPSELAMWEGEDVIESFITGSPGYEAEKEIETISNNLDKSVDVIVKGDFLIVNNHTIKITEILNVRPKSMITINSYTGVILNRDMPKIVITTSNGNFELIYGDENRRDSVLNKIQEILAIYHSGEMNKMNSEGSVNINVSESSYVNIVSKSNGVEITQDIKEDALDYIRKIKESLINNESISTETIPVRLRV